MFDDAILHLELVVNRLPTGKVVPVTLQGGRFHVAAADLREVGIPIEGNNDAPVAIDAMAGVTVAYDAATLRLMIDVPAAWLPAQHIGRDSLYAYAPARSSFGALVNYEGYATNSDRGPTNLSLWNEVRLFGTFGVFSTTGVYRYVSGNGGQRRFRRYDSYWRHSDEQRMLTYEAGDLATRSLSWGSTLRLGGVQISRDFSIRPDVVTYPLPQFSGDTAVPTAVDLFINGYRADSANIRPGPFTLTNIPFVNGAGEAVVVIADALGRQVSTTIPFYVSSELLRKGLSDFSFAAGSIRRRYGVSNFAYGAGVATGAYRYGLSDHLTIEARAEAAGDFGLGGIGGVGRLGNAGILNMAWSRSRLGRRDGDQWTVGYQYSARGFNLTAQHSRRSRYFTDLSIYDSHGFSLSRKTTSVTASFGMQRLGSLGTGYFDAETRDGARTRLANLSWSVPLWNSASLFASANQEIGTRRRSGALQLVLPLGRNRGSASAGIEQSRGEGVSRRVNYSRTAPSQGGFGWNFGYADGGRTNRYVQADLAWRNLHMEMRGGLYGGSGNYTRWASASGSLVAMGGSLFAANRINDAFAVVSTRGQPNVPVRYENQPMGKTNGKGHMLVPWASSYYPAKYAIEPLDLPAFMEAPLVEQRIAIRRGSGYLLDFPVNRVVAASVTLHDMAGKPLPVGALITVNKSATAYVGWDGLTYMEGLQAHNSLIVRLPDGAHCTAAFDLDVLADQVARIGPLPCYPDSKS